jgi:hypothetical protein
MKSKYLTTVMLALALLAALATGLTQAQGTPSTAASTDPALSAAGRIGTAFTYQGRLTDGSSPASGQYDLAFALYDDRTAGSQVGSTVPVGDVDVVDGLFTVSLDFGDVFDGTALWLQIGVRAGASGGAYSDLSPRQPLTAAPYALYARKAQSPARVVLVAQSGGDYASIQAAIDSIDRADAGNPYLVWVAPGTYNETVTMRPYIHLQGAGQEATVITSTVSTGSPATQATLVLTHHVSLRDLTVGNGGTSANQVALLAAAGTTQTLVSGVTARARGGSSNNYAVYLRGSGIGVTLQDVTALAQDVIGFGLYNGMGSTATLLGGSFTGATYGIYNIGTDSTVVAVDVTALGQGSANNYGLYSSGSAVVTLRGGSFTGRGGTINAYGIYNYNGSKLDAEDVVALAENADSTNFGLRNYFAAAEATLRGGSFVGRGGDFARSIYSGSTAVLLAQGVDALGEGGGTNSYGVYVQGGTADLVQSVLEGTNDAVRRSSGTVTVSHSRLTGGTYATAGLTCVAVSEGGTFYSNTCP